MTFQIHKFLYKKSYKSPMNSFSMYQSSWVRTNGRNWTLAKIKKFDTFLLYQTNAFLMVRSAGLEPAWHGHTPLKRTRLPVSPRPQRLCNYIITIIIFQVLIYKTIIKISNWAILNSKYEELSCFYWILFNLILI